MTEKTSEPQLLTSQREAIRAFREAEGKRGQIESHAGEEHDSATRESERQRDEKETQAEARHDNELQASEGELTATKDRADSDLGQVQSAITDARGRLEPVGLAHLLDETPPPSLQAGIDSLAELDGHARVAPQAADALRRTTADLSRWREARARARQRLVYAGIAVALIVIALCAFVTYTTYRQYTIGRLYRNAEAALESGQWGKARDELEPLLKIDADYEDAPTLLLETYYRPVKAAIEAEEWKQASSLIQRLLALDSDYRDIADLIALHPQLTMIYVSEGEFQMGRNDGNSDKKPVHTVSLDGFWLDRTEVTNGQYRRCVEAGVCTESKYAYDSDYNGDNQPVVGVDWNDAQGYCQWASKRLPTEAEWEYAARGPESLVFPWGDEFDEMKLNATGETDGYKYTAPVGSYPEGASWCGALDMAGNVWEWVADWVVAYPSGRQVNPTGPDSGSYKGLRGGAWYGTSDDARGAIRAGYSRDTRNYNVGFRCAWNS